MDRTKNTCVGAQGSTQRKRNEPQKRAHSKQTQLTRHFLWKSKTQSSDNAVKNVVLAAAPESLSHSCLHRRRHLISVGVFTLYHTPHPQPHSKLLFNYYPDILSKRPVSEGN